MCYFYKCVLLGCFRYYDLSKIISDETLNTRYEHRTKVPFTAVPHQYSLPHFQVKGCSI